ncbi:Lrp/AsnC family transcriptional regulator [Paenibacillus sp. N1-5-1-14]|uniref:Lrp/AsnC family transcriptional regulator n=1 Tax=Paenibacillus radicibacter TaxID=2972488 RepID=UPI00215953BE|nr:Lrp/AsnC family transcriptional regulator [Paenibacillus radicibacter]MCR8644626.1 Lrp/AsnC family transcriptional regulator [Paenibacillus radicibacter]
MNHSMIDDTDYMILKHLQLNGTLSQKELGQLVHLTGQAVGARVRRLQDEGIIEGYTIRVNPDKLGQSVQSFVTLFMKSPNAHQQLQSYVMQNDAIMELHRVSGEGCYWMRVRVSNHQELSTLLDELLHYGNYKVSLSINQVK